MVSVTGCFQTSTRLSKIVPPPMIQNMSKPRSASIESTRPPSTSFRRFSTARPRSPNGTLTHGTQERSGASDATAYQILPWVSTARVGLTAGDGYRLHSCGCVALISRSRSSTSTWLRTLNFAQEWRWPTRIEQAESGRTRKRSSSVQSSPIASRKSEASLGRKDSAAVPLLMPPHRTSTTLSPC